MNKFSFLAKKLIHFSKYTYFFPFFPEKYIQKANFSAMKNVINNDVLFDSYLGLRTITLNRPEKLNALTKIMIKNIYEKLIEWKQSSLTKIILLRGTGHRALCAGGDVAAVVEMCRSGLENGYKIAVDYFEQEYRLNYLIATLHEKPYVSLMDGITMGGGAGLSMHAPFRVATENTVFAMPETDIGFFPDAGASFFLSRMDGEIGKYIGMTSERIYGFDTLISGIATHYVPSNRLESLIMRLSELDTDDSSSIEYFNAVDKAIDEFSGEPPKDYTYKLGGEIREAIDRCFRFKKIENILRSLEKEGTEWAEKTINKLNQRSPTSIKIALREIQEARKWNILEAFNNELNIASYLLKRSDFMKGVEAKLIKKSSVPPIWDPPTISQVSDELIDTIFENSDNSFRLNISNDTLLVHYQKYPYNYGLPKESDLEKSIKKCINNNVSLDLVKNNVFENFFKLSPNKPGLEIKLDDIFSRKQFISLDK